MAQQATTKPLCLSTNNPESVDVGLKLCKHPPLLNYLSTDAKKLQRVLPMVAKRKAEMVLLITEPGESADTETMLRQAAILVDAANEAGVPNERILVDPGLVHITSDVGQRHFVAVMEFLKALPDAFEPAVRSTCWINGISAGAPRPSRPMLESTCLAMLSAAGLSSAFLSVLSRENRRALRLMKIFKNETVYSDRDAELY
jgi:cobalamin-dependent methionine synthase I